MQIKKDTKVKVQYRHELGTGAVLQVAEALDGYTQVDVVFEKDGKRFLETFPQSFLTPVADIFQRYQSNKSDHPTDFFLKQPWGTFVQNVQRKGVGIIIQGNSSIFQVPFYASFHPFF